MTTNVRASSCALRILSVLLLAVTGACGSGDGAPPSGGAGGAGGPLRLTLTVRPAGPDGRINASVKIEADSALASGQLSFVLPDPCKIVAGAEMRTLGEITPGRTIQQELAFECPTETAGELTASLSAKDASGQVVSSSVSAKL